MTTEAVQIFIHEQKVRQHRRGNFPVSHAPDVSRGSCSLRADMAAALEEIIVHFEQKGLPSPTKRGVRL